MASPIHCPKQKQKRLVRISLPVEFVEALEAMGRWSVNRSLPKIIELSLMWAVWAWTHGRGPDVEMMADCHGPTKPDAMPGVRNSGWGKWDERLPGRVRREVEELERLYRLGDSGSE